MSAVSTPRTFFDTNILVYADDGAEPIKQRKALDLIKGHRRGHTGVASIQVLQEYFNAATRKLGMDAAVVRRKIELLARFDVVEPKIADVYAAIDLHRLNGFFHLGCTHHSLSQKSRVHGSALGGPAARASDRRRADRESVSVAEAGTSAVDRRPKTFP